MLVGFGCHFGERAVQQAGIADQTAQAARREGPARKAENVDLVAGRVVPAQKQVGVHQRVFEAFAGDPAHQATARLVRHRVCAHAAIIIDDLLDALGIGMGDALRQFGDIGRIGLIELLPRTVQKHCKAFHRRSSPSSDRS